MKGRLMIIAIVLSFCPWVLAQAQKYWYEGNAVRAEIIDMKSTNAYDSLTVRITDMGPLPIYLGALGHRSLRRSMSKACLATPGDE